MTGRMEVLQGDITQLAVDAIVNAANSALQDGGGVDGAIHRAAGAEDLAQACRAIGHCATGDAVITPGFRLPASHIIHTVGPVWRGGQYEEGALLASCYRSSLRLAVGHGARTIAFPCISTGVYGFPFERARDIAIATTRAFLEQERAMKKVIFCCFSPADAQSYRQALELRPGEDGRD